jgi:hypothetical protein
VTFKKNGTDPITARPNGHLMGLSFIGPAFAALGIGLPAPLGRPEDEFQRYPSRRRQQRRKLKRNLVTHSRRIRRKHRRQRKAA